MSRSVSALRVVVLGSLLATAAKLAIAATTYGTDDSWLWTRFAEGVRERGPVGVYALVYRPVYNHGVISSWTLDLFNHLADHGVRFLTLTRVPSSLADAGTGVLVFLLLRGRRPEREAAWAAMAVVWSPVLLIISGFHGNTDPVFVMFVLLSLYLVAERDQPFLAGLSIAVAMSIKLVPVVALPWLAYLAWRRGPSALSRFSAAGALVFTGLWLPVLVTQWHGFLDHVLLYRGMPVREWGVSELLLLFVGQRGVDAYGMLSMPLLLLAMLAPFLLARGRRPEELAVPGLALCMCGFLAVSPAFGMQYLAWGLAPLYLLAPRRAALVFNVATSVFVVAVYWRWNGGPPWTWYRAFAAPFDLFEGELMWLTWFALLAALTLGVRDAVRTSRQPDVTAPSRGDSLVPA